MPLFKHPIVDHIPSLRRYARALTGGRPDDADDLVQDTLERAYAKWHLWRIGSELRPWLFSIMHNLFVSQVTQLKNRAPYASLDDMPEIATRATQSERLEGLDIAAAVSRLSPELREVLLLVALEDFSYVQTAKTLDIPVGTVMSRLARARQRLKEFMDGTILPEHRVGLKVVK
ncbi:RNA polymerase sigma factor [Sulfuriferula plumbiphila]|uniref:RNA polymerase sigma factor n=1 Tax=Sulfuriferula plumbiphila TaxID=171865 RepID=A0A512L650_9PROT|nr:sigma-70 family RNA polymerase sigma factor [Sulfuriferula plumbiphila]BBP03543.1 RNA polymerase sigma factor [Sulfuriferula plumbiphila]GEP29944.1 RNA polymerase sigma factor [Sulfuriferula plumbiphila]